MKKKKLNFIFYGTPNVASNTLDILKEAGYNPSLIITQPDKPKGRKMILTPPPVKIWAEKNNIPFVQPQKIDQKIIKKIEKENIDLAIVIAYGKILPAEILNLPKLSSINIHYSLLPKYRGASPIESAILNGEEKTGIVIQKMKYKLDSGPILAQKEIKIDKDDTTETLKKKLIKLGGELLVKTIPAIIDENIQKKEQDETKVSFCTKIKKEHGQIDLEKEDAKTLYNKYRAYHSWPRIFFFKNKKRIIITDAKLENQKFVIKKVIPEGKKEITWEIFLRNN